MRSLPHPPLRLDRPAASRHDVLRLSRTEPLESLARGADGDLDFLGAPRGRSAAPRIPPQGRLEKLGLPWILLSESSLFNGLRRKRSEEFLGPPFPTQAARGRLFPNGGGLAIGSRHAGMMADISVLRKNLSRNLCLVRHRPVFSPRPTKPTMDPERFNPDWRDLYETLND